MASASGSAEEELTPAQRMAAQHSASAEQSHKPTIQDVGDEAFIGHAHTLASPDVQESPPTNGESISAAAKGKGKAVNTTSAPQTNGKPQAKSLNTDSEEAFPSLGPKKGDPLAGATVWGAKPTSLTTPGRTPTPTTGRPMAMPTKYVKHSITIRKDEFKPATELRKPVAEIIRNHNKRTKAPVKATTSVAGTTFSAEGPNMDLVNQSLKEIANEVCARITHRVSVPISTLSSIIGKQGSRIQEIQRNTGARVNVNKESQRAAGLDEDDMVDIEIQGNSVTIALAEREIQSIVKDKTSSVNLRMRDVPPELFPFIAGPRNTHVQNYEDGRDVQVKIPHYHTWHSKPPMTAQGPKQPLPFEPQEGYHITISGDREHAQQVQEAIQRRAAELQRQLTADRLEIEREKHRFILGESAASLHDFLEETGCSIIMPPTSEDTETITVVGPPEHVDAAMNKVMDLATSMAMTTVDVMRQHPNAPGSAQNHAESVKRYFQQRQTLEQLERMHEASIVLPQTAGPWQIYSRDGKNGMRARKDITDLIGAQVPARYRSLENVHPFHQQHFQRQHAQSLRDQYGVHMVVAEPDTEDSPLLLVYEGFSPLESYEFPRTKPTNAEVGDFEQSLTQAEQYLLGLLEGQGEVVQQTVNAPTKYREKLHRYATRQEQQQTSEAFPVQLLGFDPALIVSPGLDTVPFAFRGPSAQVDQYQQSLLDFIDEQIRDEAERGYTTSCDFPQKFMNQLIGRRGENINRLREEFDVDVQAQDGKVEIRGPKAKADAAKAHIGALARKAEDETTHTLKIKPQFHGELIGPKGSQIRRLQERYNVRIDFPRASTSSPDTQSLADGNSDAGGPPKNRRQGQESDVVVIKGPKRGADEARHEILDLYQYMQDRSHAATVSVAQSQLPSLIGQGGRELDKLRLETGAAIDVPGTREARDASGRVEVKLRGTKEQVQKATQEISKRAKLFDETITRTLNVDKKHHKGLIGRNGENLRNMVVQAGGSEEQRNRLVRFPRADSQESAILLEGQQAVVDKLAAAIQSYVDERAQQITDTITVPQERHGGLIGAGGETRRRIESEYNISMNIPDRSATGSAREQVKLTGLPANVERAKEAIWV